MSAVHGGGETGVCACLLGIFVSRSGCSCSPQGVQIQSVMIKSISLPSDITAQMTEKTMVVSKQAQQRMHHQNAMQTNRMDQEVATMLQSFEERREQEKTSGEERVNAEQVKLNDAIAEARKQEANIQEEANVRIENIRASNKLEVQRIKDRMVRTRKACLVWTSRGAFLIHSCRALSRVV